MRLPVIAGNWKMNTNLSEAIVMVESLLPELDTIKSVEIVLCPPFISINAIKIVINGTSIKLGAQNMYFVEKGAYTGEISPLMLADLCQFVILGHSERRQFFSETNELINNKIKAALKFDLKPILCVGESLGERESNRTESIVTSQIEIALAGIDPTKDITIAYEPIWAIGTGKAATGKEANDTIGMIRNTIAKLWNTPEAQAIRILYGGSVTGSNIAEFISESEIDGALVGGASLKADDFLSIVQQTADIKSTK
jgi:triosephosphate isomerase